MTEIYGLGESMVAAMRIKVHPHCVDNPVFSHMPMPISWYPLKIHKTVSTGLPEAVKE